MSEQDLDGLAEDDGVLDPSDSLESDDLRGDVLDTGIDAGEGYRGVNRYGTTVDEERRGESLDQLLAEEEPDVSADAPWTDEEAGHALHDLIGRAAEHRKLGAYNHVFTHFALTQDVWSVDVDEAEIASLLRRNNRLQRLSVGQGRVLPTVFAKAIRFDPYGLLI